MLKRYALSPLMLLLIAALLSFSVHAHAQSRVALVVGNGAYKIVAGLANPPHDAQDVSEALKRLGFDVKTVTDADFDTFRRALLEFGRTAVNADVALLFYAGHGIEINGDNWLLPTDVELKNDVDASTEAIGLRTAMQAVSTAKTLGLVIVDACRNNPFQSGMSRSVAARSVQIVGLAPVEPADNVLVAYSARDGTVAHDGAGRNSPYTAALLRHIETPGLEVDFLFRNIRDDVMAATNNEQQPFVYGSLSSNEIYFKAPPPEGVASTDPTPSPDAAEIAWSFLKSTKDVSTLTRFVDRFPESSHIPDVKVRIASLATPGVATDAPPPATLFADSEFEQAEKAVARRFVRDTPAIEAAWNVINETKDHKLIRRFVDQFPSKKRRLVADTRLVALGQKPITVHAQPPQFLDDVDESILLQAADDRDVVECFNGGDQTAPACQNAFQRFPDIARFVDDVRFTVRFCATLGNPIGCLPTIKSAWNFPSKQGNGDIGSTTDVPTTTSKTGATGSAGGNGNFQADALIEHDVDHESRKFHAPGGGGWKHHLKTTDVKTKSFKNNGFKNSGFKNPAIKTSGVKVTSTGTPTVKVPTIHAPVVRPPNVKVDVRIPDVHVR